MTDWPAYSEQTRSAVAPHDTGTGLYRLTTRTWIHHDGRVSEFRCVHRFLTAQAREAFRAVARHHALTIEEVEV